MYRVHTTDAPAARDGALELSFRSPETWPMLPYRWVTGAKRVSILLGDAEAGPLAVLAAFPPLDVEIPGGTPHGHDSDNWRVSLLGESHMGTATYGPRQFRFQQGGKPYGRDDYASGPEGGHHLVLFADRRGFRTKPVKKELEAIIGPQDDHAARALGINVVDPYPELARGLVTNIGSPDKAGKVEGSFAEADRWPELRAGVRLAAGALGDRVVGPLILLLHVDAHRTAVVSSRLPVEVLYLVVSGGCRIGDRTYGMGDIRLQEADARCPDTYAGPGGLDLLMLLADRRGVVDGACGPWDDALTEVVADLARRAQALPTPSSA